LLSVMAFPRRRFFKDYTKQIAAGRGAGT
jgi:hypothetical protein